MELQYARGRRLQMCGRSDQTSHATPGIDQANQGKDLAGNCSMAKLRGPSSILGADRLSKNKLQVVQRRRKKPDSRSFLPPPFLDIKRIPKPRSAHEAMTTVMRMNRHNTLLTPHRPKEQSSELRDKLSLYPDLPPIGTLTIFNLTLTLATHSSSSSPCTLHTSTTCQKLPSHQVLSNNGETSCTHLKPSTMPSRHIRDTLTHGHDHAFHGRIPHTTGEEFEHRKVDASKLFCSFCF